MALTYKTIDGKDGEKLIVANDKGLPIVIDDEQENKEFGINAIEHYSQIPKLRTEAANNRKAFETSEARFTPLKDHEIDPDNLNEWLPQAKDAITKLENIDQKKLIDANEVETIKLQAQEKIQSKLDEVTNKYQTRLEGLEKSVKDKDGTIFGLMVNDKFYNSKFVKGKLNMTPKVAAKYFGENFKVEDEDGKQSVIAYGKDGQRIYSKEDIGAIPDFDEALALLVDADEDRDMLLKGKNASGTGANDNFGSDYKLSDNPWKKESVNLSRQGEISTNDPDMAARMQREAGVAT